MTAPVDLAGQPFGKLKVTGLSKDRARNGERLWECECECGNKTTAATSALSQGRKRSCGCLRGAGSPSFNGFTKAKARAAYNDKRRIKDDHGDWWFALREAMRYLKVRGESTLPQWATNCPLLDGAAIETRELPGAFERMDTYYKKDDLDRIQKKRAELAVVPTHPGLVPISKAARMIRVSAKTLYRLTKRYRENVERLPCKTAFGVRRRAYVTAEFVERAKAERAGAGETLSVREAAKLLGLAYETTMRFVRKGPLRPLAHGTRKNGVRASRLAVEELRKKRDAEDAAQAGATERWKDARTLARIHRTSRYVLDRWLGRWVAAGELQYEKRWRWRTKPLRCRERVRFYDADAVARLMAARRAGGKNTPTPPAPSNGTNPAETVYQAHSDDGDSTPGTRGPKKRRGRPQGKDPKVAERIMAMLKAWDCGEFDGNKAAAGRAHGFHRPDATKIINAHEGRKREK